MAQEGLKLSLALSQPAPVLTWFLIWGNVCAGPEAPVQLLERAGLTSMGTQSSRKQEPWCPPAARGSLRLGDVFSSPGGSLKDNNRYRDTVMGSCLRSCCQSCSLSLGQIPT